MHTQTQTKAARNKARNSTEHAFCYGDIERMLQGPICQFFRRETGGVGHLNGSLPGCLCLHHFTCTDNNKKNKLKLRQKYPTWFRTKYCRLTVNIICIGSCKGTPFIPNNLKLGPLSKATYTSFLLNTQQESSLPTVI